MTVPSDTLEAPRPDEPVTPAPEQEVSAAPETAPEGGAAPPGDESAEPKSLLDAALKALKQEPEGQAAAAEPAGDKVESPAAQTPEQTDHQGDAPDGVPMLPDDVFKALPKEARGAINTLRTTVARLKPDAERGAAVADFIRTSGVTPEEYLQLQDVGALLKRDPMAARKVLVDKLAEIDRVMGVTLPDDLREEVEDGYITEERARELSQTRARADRADGAIQAQAEDRRLYGILSGVTEWETETRRGDPDFDRKLPHIQELTKAAVIAAGAAGKPVSSAAEAVEMARQAYSKVNALVTTMAPSRSATRAVPSSAASAPAGTPAPKSLLEAARAGLARAGR